MHRCDKCKKLVGQKKDLTRVDGVDYCADCYSLLVGQVKLQ